MPWTDARAAALQCGRDEASCQVRHAESFPVRLVLHRLLKMGQAKYDNQPVRGQNQWAKQWLNEYSLCVVISGLKLAMREPGGMKAGPQLLLQECNENHPLLLCEGQYVTLAVVVL